MIPVNFYFIIRSISRIDLCFSTWLSREQITVGSEERHDMKPHVESLTM